MTRNTFMKVSITYFNNRPELSYGHMYLSVDNCQLELSHDMPLEDAEAEMEKLKERLGAEPTRSVNRYNNDMIYVELYGFLD